MRLIHIGLLLIKHCICLSFCSTVWGKQINRVPDTWHVSLALFTDAGSAGEQDHPDEVNKSEPRTNPVPPAVSSDNTKDNNKPSVNADRSQDTADKVDHASSKTVHSDDGFSKVVENTKGKDMEMELESPPRKPPLNDLIEQQNAYIARVKVDLPTEPANMEGPIIALSLGLAFTVIILVFVACRLRNVRRRLRKGRPLHSNEADYLINGMYL